MREHELELIAALAEGRLEDESEARALISSSEEARTEFEAQRLALGALSAMAPVSMSETERVGLRRYIWTELRTQAPTPATGSGNAWYYRWMPVAAGMFILVGLVAVLSQGGLGGIVAADQAASETTLADAVTTMAQAEEFDSGGGGDDADGSDTGGETVTEAPTSTMTADSGDVDVSEQAPPAAAAFYSAEADEIRSSDEPVYRSLGDFSTIEIEQCLEEAGFDGYEVRKVDATPEEPEETGEEVPEEAIPYVAATPFGEDPSTASVVFVALETCDVIHVDQ